MPEAVRRRLLSLAGARATSHGEIVIEARRYRSQARNREDAETRLVELIRRAAVEPKPRRKKRISAAEKRRIVDSKRRRGAVKKRRAPVRGDDE